MLDATLLDESQRLFPKDICGGNNACQDLILVEHKQGSDSALLHVLICHFHRHVQVDYSGVAMPEICHYIRGGGLQRDGLGWGWANYANGAGEALCRKNVKVGHGIVLQV